MMRLLIAVALFGSLSLPAARAQDQVHYFDRKSQETKVLKGVISKESPAGVTCKPTGGKEVVIPAPDITEVVYQYHDNEKFAKLQWERPTNALLRVHKPGVTPAARKKDLDTALSGFQELAPLVAGMTEKRAWIRHVQFGIAQTLALQAEDDAREADAAIDALKKFKTDHGDGWQLVKATKLLVHLLEQKGDEAGAQAAYAELADNEAAPKEVRHEFRLLGVRYLLRKGKHPEAAAKAKALQKDMAPDDPQAQKVKVYLAACDIAARKYDTVEKDLKAVIESGADNDVKALARNTLGDYYRAQNQGDKAFWEYLWVDVHYNQDREELARALYNLSKLYADVRKDAVRAKECQDRVCDEGQFGGLEYHVKAKAERGAGGGK